VLKSSLISILSKKESMLIRSTVLLGSHYPPRAERVPDQEYWIRQILEVKLQMLAVMLILVRQICVVQAEDLEEETRVNLMVRARTAIPSAMC
jgi:hypothetical protein